MQAIRALEEVGRTLDSLPSDLAMAIQNGRVPGLIVHRFMDLERSPILRWLMRVGGFKERLLADDLFLTKVAIECGVGVFTKVFALHLYLSLVVVVVDDAFLGFVLMLMSED